MSSAFGSPGMKKVAIFVDTTLPVSRDLVRGVTQYANTHGPWLFFHEYHIFKSKQQQHALISHLKNWKPDGMIIREETIHPDIIGMKIPLIVNSNLQNPIPGAVNLVADDIGIGVMAADYFLKRGFYNLGFVGYKQNLLWPELRFKGFADVLAKHNRKVHLYKSNLFKVGNMDMELKKLGQWIFELPKPVGILACSDIFGLQVTEACKLFQLAIPQMVAVLGVHNDDIICETSYPPMSSIALNSIEAGYLCGQVLDQLMTDPSSVLETEIPIRPTHVITRQSTNIMASTDEDILQSIQYIQDNMNRLILVEDVANHVGISSRQLQRKFKKITGVSVHEQITHIKMSYICKLLIETTMQVSQIAIEVGFSDATNFSRYFTEIKGLSPIEFRRMHLYR